MGGIFDLIRKLRSKGKEASLLVLGLDNAGKTTILKKLSNEDISQIEPTHGFNIKNLVHDEFKLTLWDVGGQETIREYWSNYFEGRDALVYVIDSADEKRVEEASKELTKLLEDENLKDIPLLVYANKQDLGLALSCEEIMETLKLEEIDN